MDDSYPPCPFCQSTDIQREKHPNGKTWCGGCRRSLGNYDKGIIPTILEFNLAPLKRAYQNRDWLNVASELNKIMGQTAGPLFVDQALRWAFGPALKDLGCTCPQVFSIVANEQGIGCEVCQIVLSGEPFMEESDELAWDE